MSRTHIIVSHAKNGAATCGLLAHKMTDIVPICGLKPNGRHVIGVSGKRVSGLCVAACAARFASK